MEDDFVSKELDDFMKRCPLRTRIFIHLQMGDYQNWDKGEYKGDNLRLIKETNWLIKHFKEFYEDGMPQGFQLMDEETKPSTSTGLVGV